MISRIVRRLTVRQIRFCTSPPGIDEFKFPLQTPPVLDQSATVLGGSHVIGDVELYPGSNIWYNCIIRGDTNKIKIEARSSVGDGSTLQSSEQNNINISEDVTIGQRCVIIGSSIKENTLIEPSSTILDGCSIGVNCVVEAGAVLDKGTYVADGWTVHQKYISGVKQHHRRLSESELKSVKQLRNVFKQIPESNSFVLTLDQLFEFCSKIDKTDVRVVYSLFSSLSGLQSSSVQKIAKESFEKLSKEPQLLNIIKPLSDSDNQFIAASVLSLSQVHRVRIPDTSYVYSAQSPPGDGQDPSSVA